MDKLNRKLVTFGKRNKACMALALLCVFFLYAFAVILDKAELAYKALRGNAGRRIAAAALSTCMVLALLPTAAFAEVADYADSGAVRDSGVVLPLITGFAPLDEAIRTQRVGADDLVLPETLLATVEDEETEIAVTWDGLDAVNEARKSGGLFVLTANVGEGYRLAEGVTAPSITAMILGMGRILGAGTAANPLQLRTEAQLREIAALTNAGTLSSTVFGPGSTDMVYIKLMNDLDISGSQWTPIGTITLDESSGDPDFTKVFNGVFDGNGKTIKGLTIDDADAMVAGLFGVTATGSEVKNLTLTDVSVSGGMLGAGGVAAMAMGDISGCAVSGTVTTIGGAGGVAAAVMGDISACTFSGSVTGGDSVGGVVGGANGAVSNCYATSTVTGSGGSIGGVVGSADGAVSNCYATGTVSGDTYVGGVVGGASNRASVINCAGLNPSVSSATDSSYGACRVYLSSGGADSSDNIAFAGMKLVNSAGSGIAHDSFHGADITDLATLKATYEKWNDDTSSVETVTSTVFDDTTVWNTFDGTTLPTLVGVGPQTLARPAYLHADGVSPFDGTGTDVDPYQIAAADQLRELARLVNSGDTTYNASGKWFKLTANLDISGSEWTPIGNDSNNFDANFDGDGKTITGLTINQPTKGYVGLFGYAADTATMQNLGVINADVTGKEYVGGVVGFAHGAITNCYATGTVTGGNYVGGVVGDAANSTVSNCYSTGSVTGTDYVGGVAGSTSGAVYNCVALNPTITATDSNPTVGRVASSGTISGGYAYAGMKVNGATVTGGAAINTNGADITDLATFDGKFTDANGWSAFTGETLPTLKSAEANSTLDRPAHLLATPFKGTGTQADPYQISTADQLRHLGTLVNSGDTAYNAEGKWFKLTANLDISGSEWTPIANGSNKFAANFDGNGHTITGLTINQPTMNGVGLFGFADINTTIQNLGVININVTGGSNLGGVVGISSGVVSNCYSTGAVTGENYVGGVVGGAYKTVSNCYSTGSITGTDFVGGVVGGAFSTVSNCYSTGIVSGKNTVGGVVAVGDASSTVSNCVALNPSITAIDGHAIVSVGRVAGGGSITAISGCAAYAGMTVNGAVVTGGAANNKNGADATKASFKTANWWKNTAAFPDASWVLANNNLPALKTTGGTLIAGQKTDLPVFLTELPPPPPDPDLAIVEAAKTAAENATYTATTQADTGTEAAAKAYVENIVKTAVNNSDVTVAVNKVSYTTPTAGTAANPSGTNGSYKFTVTVSKGLQSETTTEKTITITATAFTGITDVQAVAAAKAAVVDSSVNVAFGADQDAKTAAVQSYVNSKLTGNATGVTATVTHTSDNSYLVEFSKGSVTDSKSITMTINESNDPDALAVAAAKTAIESILSNFAVSNATTAQDILNAANGATSGGVTVAWDSANGFTKTDATADATGSITGSLKLTLNSETATVAVNKTIPKLTVSTYTVTLDANGGSVTPTILSVAAGGTAALPTPTRSGSYRFDGWFTATSGGTPYTSATPINSSVTLYAHWTYTGGGSSGDSGSSSGGGSSGGSLIVTPPTPDKPNASTESEIKVPGTVDGNGNATATITDKAVSDAIRQAEDTARKNGNLDNGITLVLNVDTGSRTATSFSVNLPRVTQETIISKKVVNTVLVVNNPDIQIGIDLAAVEAINTQAKADVSISATRMDNAKLTGAAKTAIGSRPAFDLKATYQNGAKSITGFGGGSAGVALPYTLQAGEVPGGVYAVYVDANGKVSYITGSSYDAQNKVLRFATNHFSVYGIGYKAPASFTDIANHWAKADIEFVANRGLMNGTSNTTFSPTGSMTRGMFVTALGRLAGIDSAKYTNTKFTDVAATSSYAPYVAWATEKGITVGTSATTFGPDKTVTRQEMAVFMARYAKTMGYKVPQARAAITFADNSSIGSWAAAAVKQMQMAGVLNGKNGNKFDPNGTATRAEVAAVLHSYMELVIDPATAQGLDVNDSGSAMLYENGRLVKSQSRTVNSRTYNFNANGEAVLPADSKKYILHTVKKNEYFHSISRMYGCTQEEIMALNGFRMGDGIHPGDVLKVPQQ